jgi:peptidoglycan/xylan/chitin deacetylase (PgdA/CDA1 family)
VPAALPLAATGATALGLSAGGLWYASLWPTSQLFGPTLIAANDPNEIALTFDDGPNPVATPQLLQLLARHNVRATFFSIGAYVREYPALAQQIVAAGHLIGNHTMDHPRLSTQPAQRIRRELADCNAALEDATGAPVRYFRPPFGARRPFVLRAARELGLTPVMWNVTAYDWKPIGADRILANLESGIARNRRHSRGSNLLLHDGGHRTFGSERMETVRAVERLLEACKGSATRFVAADAWG